MKKLQYIQPKTMVEVTEFCDSIMQIELSSSTGPQPAPKRGVAPEVPGESL